MLDITEKNLRIISVNFLILGIMLLYISIPLFESDSINFIQFAGGTIMVVVSILMLAFPILFLKPTVDSKKESAPPDGLFDQEKITKGFNTHRLNPEDNYCRPEIIFQETFQKRYDRDMYDALKDISGIKRAEGEDKHLTDREQRLMLSVVQWMGSPSGQGFIEECQEKIKQK